MRVWISGDSGSGHEQDNPATGDVNENEAVFRVSATGHLTDEDGNAVACSFADVSVSYSDVSGTAEAGADYQASSGSVTLSSDSSSSTITVAINDDATDEWNETFTVELSGGGEGVEITTATATGTIISDDAPPLISISNVSVTEGNPVDPDPDPEDGVDPGTVIAAFTVSLTKKSGKQITVNYNVDSLAASEFPSPDPAVRAKPGIDYAGISTPLTFEPGQTSKTIEVRVLPDFIDEYSEVFHVVLSGPSNASLNTAGDELGDPNRIVGVGTIGDNDPLPKVTIDDTIVKESGGEASFTIRRDRLSEKGGVFVVKSANLSAVGHSSNPPSEPYDFSLTSALKEFGENEEYVTFAVPVTADALDEGSERFKLHVEASTSSDNYDYTDAEGVATIVGVNLRTDSNADGLPNDADEPVEMDEPGRALQVGGLAEVQVLAGETDALYGFMLAFSISSNIRVWTSPAKTTEISSGTTFEIGLDPILASVYVEGIASGAAIFSATIVGPEGQYSHDSVLLTVYSYSVSIERGPLVVQWNSDWDKESVAGTVPRPDYEATGTTGAENDDELEEVEVTITGDPLEGTYKLEFSDKLRVYLKTDEGSIWEWTDGYGSPPFVIDQPNTKILLLVEGKAVSEEPWDQYLQVTFTPSLSALPPVGSGISATVVNVDVQIAGTSWWEEDTSAGMVPLNQDHDEGKFSGGFPVPDHMGNDLIVMSDNELRSGFLVIDSAGLEGTWALTAANGTKVWSMEITGVLEQVSSDTLTATLSSIDDTILVEGTAVTYGAPAAMTLTFTATDGGGSVSDQVSLIVMSLNLTIPGFSEYEEDNIVAVIPVNDDHDEENFSGSCPLPVTDNHVCPATVAMPQSLVDMEYTANPDDDEVVEASLTIGAPNGTEGVWWISAPPSIKVYEKRTTEAGVVVSLAPDSIGNARHITSGDTSDLHVALLLEGISKSGNAESVVAHFEPTSSSGSLSDAALVATLDADIQLDFPAIAMGALNEGLNEWEEREYGAFVQRNIDFSKGVQVEGVLVPDYMASNIPDNSSGYTRALVRFDSSLGGQVAVLLTFPNSIGVWYGTTKLVSPATLTLPASQKQIYLEIEGLVRSDQAASELISVEVSPIADTESLAREAIGLKDNAAFAVVEINAAVDGDRDGIIDHANPADSELVFWYNNDNDGNYEPVQGVQSDEPVDDYWQRDAWFSTIQGSRDLEDLAPFNVFLDDNLLTLANGVPGLSVVMGFQNLPIEELRINLFNDYLGQHADALRHVTNESQISDRTTSPYFSTRIAALENTGEESPNVVVPNLSNAPPHGTENPFLFEALPTSPDWDSIAPSNVISLGYEAEVKYPTGRTRKLEDAVTVFLEDIKRFYDVYQVLAQPWHVQDPEHGPFANYSRVQTANVNLLPGFEGDDYVMLVHGWNMTPFWKDAFAETAVKRMYWQGFTGRFGAFNWPTLVDEVDGWDWPDWPDFLSGVNQTYNPSELQAFRSGAALKNVLVELKDDGRSVTVAAHSMGNVVTGEALRLWSDENPATQLISNYVAMEAAVSSGAYASDASDARYVDDSNRDFYRHFPVSNVVTAQAANEALFADTTLASGGWYNIYNEVDYALGLWEWNNSGKDSGFGNTAIPSWDYEYDFSIIYSDPATPALRRRYEELLSPWQDLRFFDSEGGLLNAYEILAFLSVSNAKPLGQIEAEGRFINIPLDTLGYTTTMVGGMSRANHSYQFHYDIHATWAFWKKIKTISGGL